MGGATTFESPLAGLDPALRQYLELAEARKLDDRAVLIPRPFDVLTGPRSGWLLLLTAGVALMAATVWLTLGPASEAAGERWPPYAQAILFGAGLFCLAWGVVRYHRAQPEWRTRGFVLADACTLWDVKPARVTATPLSNLLAIDLVHKHVHGSYTQSRLTLHFAASTVRHTVRTMRVAESLFAYLLTLRKFRFSDRDDWQELAERSPGRLGLIAAAVARDGKVEDFDEIPDAPAPFAPPDESVGVPRRSVVAPILMSLAAAFVGFFAFGAMNARNQDHELFASAEAGQSVAPVDQYLATFPSGRHAEEAKLLRDDRRFEAAVILANGAKTPAELRSYLAHQANTRHRDGARAAIVAIYDQEIARVKALAKPGQTDDLLLEGMVGLLNAMKGADRPIATVGFRGRQRAVPIDAGVLAREAEAERSLQVGNPMIRLGMLGRNSGGVIDPGEAFGQAATARRETVILQRLRDAISRGIRPDILTLEAVAPGGVPMIEVEYKVEPDGTLAVFSSTGPFPEARGLVRGYAIDWTIHIRPPGADAIAHPIRSKAADSLRYDMAASDPPWGVYAVAMYSSFHDMSARLIRGIGLDPGTAPNTFTFAAAARTSSGNDAGPFGGPMMPGMPAFPEMGGFPRMPGLEMPGFDMPAFPKMPALPGMNDFPRLPGMPPRPGPPGFGRPPFGPIGPGG